MPWLAEIMTLANQNLSSNSASISKWVDLLSIDLSHLSEYMFPSIIAIIIKPAFLRAKIKNSECSYNPNWKALEIMDL